MTGIVVIGAGQAGLSLAARLRASGFDGALTLIGDEHHPPYQRPPLSKKYLLGEMTAERLLLRPRDFYGAHRIDLRLGRTVGAIDRAGRKVILDGEALGYDMLALTTGAVPRRLPPGAGGRLAGVHVVRTLRHIDEIAPQIRPGARVLIVGGGYIGLEIAAICAQRDLRVTLVEMTDRILQRVAARETSDWFGVLHRAHGVDLRENVALERLTGSGRVDTAVLSDGAVLPVDLVILGLGIRPATGLAEAAGLAIEDGIAVDPQGRSSDPRIWAAGDCASFPRAGGRIRLESVQNAIDQAELVAGNMLGAEAAYDPVPWFWSDQYDVKLQIAGLGAGHDRVVVRPGPSARSASHWYFGGGALLAVDAMNDPRAYMVGKRLLEAGRTPAAAALADPATDLKTLLG